MRKIKTFFNKIHTLFITLKWKFTKEGKQKARVLKEINLNTW